MKSPIEQFIDAMDNEPIDNTNPHPKLFSDINDGRELELFDLWQWGCLDASWDDEANQTMWEMSDFGEEILQKGVDEIWFEMMQNEEQYNKSPSPDAKRFIK